MRNSAPHRIITVRICDRCGTTAAEAAQQAEPICSDGGLVGPHRFVDRRVDAGAYHPLTRAIAA